MTFTLAPRPMTATPALFGFVALDLYDGERYFGLGETALDARADAFPYTDDLDSLNVIRTSARFLMAAASESEMLPASEWHVVIAEDGARYADLRDTTGLKGALDVFNAIASAVQPIIEHRRAGAATANQSARIFEIRVDWSAAEGLTVTDYPHPYRGTWSNRVAFQVTCDALLDSTGSIARRLVMGGDHSTGVYGTATDEA
jgi:hypothetical protein